MTVMRDMARPGLIESSESDEIFAYIDSMGLDVALEIVRLDCPGSMRRTEFFIAGEPEDVKCMESELRSRGAGGREEWQ